MCIIRKDVNILLRSIFYILFQKYKACLGKQHIVCIVYNDKDNFQKQKGENFSEKNRW